MKKEVIGIALLALTTVNTLTVVATDSIPQNELKTEFLEMQAAALGEPFDYDSSGKKKGTKWEFVCNNKFEDGYNQGVFVEMYECHKTDEIRKERCRVSDVCFVPGANFCSPCYDGRFGNKCEKDFNIL